MRCMSVAILVGWMVATTSPVIAAADLPLIDAVRGGDERAVRALLEDGVEFDARLGDGSTALHWAVHEGRVGLVDLQAEVYDGAVYDGEGLRDAVADAPVRRVGGAPSALPAQEKGEPQTPRCWSALGLAQRKLWR